MFTDFTKAASVLQLKSYQLKIILKVANAATKGLLKSISSHMYSFPKTAASRRKNHAKNCLP